MVSRENKGYESSLEDIMNLEKEIFELKQQMSQQLGRKEKVANDKYRQFFKNYSRIDYNSKLRSTKLKEIKESNTFPTLPLIRASEVTQSCYEDSSEAEEPISANKIPPSSPSLPNPWNFREACLTETGTGNIREALKAEEARQKRLDQKIGELQRELIAMAQNNVRNREVYLKLCEENAELQRYLAKLEQEDKKNDIAQKPAPLTIEKNPV